MTLLDKLTELKDRFVGGRADIQDVAVIDAWISEAKRLFIINSLKDHDGIKYVLMVFEKEIGSINEVLLNNRSLDCDTRLRLLDKRDLCQKYLDVFNGVNERLEQIEDKVNSEL